MMLKWLNKFVLDIMPSVAATIIGAYIVNHYIIPKSPAASQAAISSTDSKPTELKASESKASEAKPSESKPFEAKPSEAKAGDGSADKSAFEKAVAEKAAIEKTAEKAASEKAANDKTGTDRPSDSAESRKHLPAPKVAAKPAPAPAADERRANDLARAAIERLAKSEAKSEPKTELSRTESSRAESKPADTPRLQPASTVVSAPPMQPLPPAINVATPNPDVFEQGNAAPVVRQPYPQAASRSDDAREPRRFAPPADIPTSRPLDLRAEAMSPSSSERTSVTDEVVSVAKSMFHAVMPR